jgi:hypothetical protein
MPRVVEDMVLSAQATLPGFPDEPDVPLLSLSRVGCAKKSGVQLLRRQALLAGLLPLVPRAAFAEESSADAQARWIAGLSAPPGAPSSPEWTAYAAAENERWQLSRPRLTSMHDWSSRELTPFLPKEHLLFYPFAGPDVLSALALFGGSRRLLLVGLEPVGALPDPPAGAAPGFFARLGAALGDVHRLTFFRTREMATDFRQDGVLGALVATIARMGGRVGGVQTAAASALPPSPPRARIDWTTPAGEARRLDYVQADLSNAGFKAQAPLAANVHALAPCVTFVKAAMYLLAEPRFSSVRQLILEDSALVVQDDTGVPLRHFDARWAVRLFGRYETPGAPFEERFQQDLRAAFDRRAPSLLPFGLGYHVDARRSNLLIASRGR